jgi:hypothetical protein
MAQLEIFDGTNWIQLGGQTNIALTGAVIGNGSGSIITTLNNYQTMVGSTLSFDWSNNGQFQEYSNYHTLQDSNPPPHFVHLVQSGSGSTYRRWLTVYKPGFGSQPTGSYEINFYHAANGFQYPFKIDTYGSTLLTYFGTIVDMQNNEIINLLSPTTSTSAATKGYIDGLTSWFTKGGNRIGFNMGISIAANFALNLNYGYLNPNGNVGTSGGTNNYSIDCSDRIKASEFNAYSSIKKKIILAKSKDIEEEAEKVFSRIPLFKYEYKDKIKEGNGISYGVIAESLNEVLPDYVDMKSYDFVPNIMSKVNIKKLKNGYYEIQINNVDIASKKLRILTDIKHVDVDIVEINKNIITISSNETLKEEEFIYGTYETCPTVSKQKLFELSMIVIQNLIKRIEKLENKLIRESNE